MAFEYDYRIRASFKALPKLQPLILKTQDRDVFQRLVNATRRRQFRLVQDWEITVEGTGPDIGIEGVIVVPVEHDGEVTILDGASVPLPWVVSYLTFGVLRPLGILLTASVVHDFAYRHGELLVRAADGSLDARAIERHHADELFGDIIASVNQSPVASRIAYHAVRLGWPFIRYAGQRGTGRAPVASWLVLFIVLAVLIPLVKGFGFAAIVSCLGVGYALLSLAQVLNPQVTDRVDPE